MSKLTDVEIPIDSNNNTTVSFLLLQTHLQQNEETVHSQQMNNILYELYNQVAELQQEQKEAKNSANNMLVQCTAIAQGYKKGQEELFNISQDRLRLVKQLKESTDQSLQLLEENEQLKKIVSTMEELNTALTTRYQQMEKEVKQLSQGPNFKASIKGLSQDYDEMISANNQMQKEMSQFGKMAVKMEELSLPIRVIKVAFSSNSNLRQLVMKQAEKELGSNQDLRDIFFDCKFDLGEVLSQ